MRISERRARWGLLLAGAATMTTSVAAIAPQTGLMLLFGTTVSDPLALLIVRSWAVLVSLIGAGLIYACIRPNDRRVLVGLAMISKTAFMALLLGFGGAYLGTTWSMLIFDCAMIVFFAALLMQADEAICDTVA